MSGDETFTLVISLIAAVITWSLWFYTLKKTARAGFVAARRWPLLVMPAACLLGLVAVLRFLASHDVRDDEAYLAMYTIMGAGWVGSCMLLTPWLGLSMRDDAVERGNPAAVAALCGAIAGFTLCFAGANIGDGPGWWVVVFCAGLSTASLLALWMIVEAAAHVGDSITIDRSVADGLRFMGFLAGCGLILGRAVAGNWRGAEATIADWAAVCWPVLVVAAIEIGIGRLRRSNVVALTSTPPLVGAMSGLLYVAAAVVYVIFLGWWT